jgi:hypothetical protein
VHVYSYKPGEWYQGRSVLIDRADAYIELMLCVPYVSDRLALNISIFVNRLSLGDLECQ